MNSLDNIVRSNIRKLKGYSSARDEYSGNEGIFLDANENPFGTLNRYPDPYQRGLKKKISELRVVPEENIFIGNGSDEVIDLAFRIFCNPGMDKALTFSPTYGMYDVSAAINDTELIKLPLTSNFQIDLDKLKPLLTDPKLKLIFICSPNNPSGNLLRKADIEFILKSFSGIVIVDEAYIDFSKAVSFSEYILDFPRLIVSQTFSKAWGLAGARLGVAIANPEVIDYFNKVKPPYNVSTLNQTAALKALNDYNSFEKKIELILNEKDKMIQKLRSLECVKKIYPSDANFLLVEFSAATKKYNQLAAKKIIIRNKSKDVSECLRITIGSPEENATLISALKKL